jgi:HSP20 family molecular chaperone IbpA
VVPMAEEGSRDRDGRVSDSIDRVMRRIDAHRSLPTIDPSGAPALGPPTAIATEGPEVRQTEADVVVTPARIFVTLELPGASRETIEVLADDARLTVHAIAEARVFHTEIPLTHPIEPDAVTATYRNGVLDVVLPRRRGHRVRVKRGD